MESIGIIIAMLGLIVISILAGSGFYSILIRDEDEDFGSTVCTLVVIFVVWALAIYSIITLGHILVNMGGN